MPTESISQAARVKCLRLIADKAYPELATLVIPPGLAWVYAQQHAAWPMVLWCVVIMLMAGGMWQLRQRLQRDMAQLEPQALLERWEPIVTRTAIVSGLVASAPVWLAFYRSNFEFMVLVYVALSGTTSAAATYLTPVFKAFKSFFTTAWLLPVVLVLWAFPKYGGFILAVSVLYTFIMYKHARASYGFVLEQSRLEEHSAFLAEQYKQAKDQAEGALQAKSQFFSTASHDLRQPVHAMGMLIETLRQRNHDQLLKPLLTDLHSCVRSVNLMFNSLLDLSRIEASQQPGPLQPVALAPLVQEVFTLFTLDAAQRGLALRWHAPRQTAWVQADPVLLRQALGNLIHNALRYTRSGGVLVGLRRRGAQWQLQVWDTGMGVAQHEQTAIFSPYYRHENAWQIDSAGHGLGLAVVAQCAQRMGATHGLRSQLGKGSCFWLSLPVAASTGAEAALPMPDLSAPLAKLGGCCLVVEDDPYITNAWQALLQDWGVQARFASDGAQAFACLANDFAPQVILCDQRLRSGESGFDILQALLERCPQAQGAMVSGEHQAPELVQAEEEGYVVLRKPVDVREMHALLQRWLMHS
jgi:signal transduction histidine kinase/CheY-like chemotaxis protein